MSLEVYCLVEGVVFHHFLELLGDKGQFGLLTRSRREGRNRRFSAQGHSGNFTEENIPEHNEYRGTFVILKAVNQKKWNIKNWAFSAQVFSVLD